MGNAIQNKDPLERIPAAITFFGTFCIILVYITFQNIRRFRHVELIFYIACSDFLASIGLLLVSNDLISLVSVECYNLSPRPDDNR